MLTAQTIRSASASGKPVALHVWRDQVRIRIILCGELSVGIRHDGRVRLLDVEFQVE